MIVDLIKPESTVLTCLVVLSLEKTPMVLAHFKSLDGSATLTSPDMSALLTKNVLAYKKNLKALGNFSNSYCLIK